MSARSELFDELPKLQAAVDTPLLFDQDADERVKLMLLAGISVAHFVALEDFFRNRTRELAAFLSQGVTSFADLPEKSRQLIVRRSVNALAADAHSSWMDHQSRLTSAVEFSQAFARLSSLNLAVSHHVFRWSGSNLQLADVEAAFAVLGCTDKLWESLNQTLTRALRLRNTVLVKSLFSQLAEARHRAAHQLDPDLSLTVVRSLPLILTQLCLAIDLLASHLSLDINRGRLLRTGAAHDSVRLYFMEPVGAMWRFKAEIGRRVAAGPNMTIRGRRHCRLLTMRRRRSSLWTIPGVPFNGAPASARDRRPSCPVPGYG